MTTKYIFGLENVHVMYFVKEGKHSEKNLKNGRTDGGTDRQTNRWTNGRTDGLRRIFVGGPTTKSF